MSSVTTNDMSIIEYPVDPQTDRLLRAGKVLNLHTDFDELPDPYAATLSPNKEDVTSYGFLPERPVLRVYPRDGKAWWVMREQVTQLRSALGLEDLQADPPTAVGDIEEIKIIRDNADFMDLGPGIEPIGDAQVEVTDREQLKLLAVMK